MLNPVGSSSNLSDTSEIRYQKAVREINKLIGINNSMKKDTDHYRAACDNLQMQNRQLIQRLDIANKQKRSFDETIKNYEKRIRELESMNQSFRAKQATLFTASAVENQRSKHLEQIAILNQKLTEQGNTIINLQQNVAQLQKDNKNLKINYQKTIEGLRKQLEQSQKRVSFNQCIRCPEYKQKMNENIEYRRILQKQIIDLKKGITYSMDPTPKLPQTRNQKDKVIDSLGERVRILEQKFKRKNIEIYKLTEKLEKSEHEFAKYKQKQILLETTAIQK